MTHNTPPHAGLTGGPVYLDYNATTPVDPRVAEAMLPHLTRFFGNPSSDHPYSVEPRSALAHARAQVAALIGARADEIVFTASGSEADLLALRGAVLASGRRRPHVITQVTEHPAVLESCRALQRLHNARVTLLPVDGDGLVDPAALTEALDEDTVLVSVMAANNETGALQPIGELAARTRAHGALFHCDAAQTAGKIPLDVTALGVDLLTLVGHKMYAPKGVAALYVRDGVRLEPVVYGGGQERGLRAGTENVAFAVALGAAAQLAADELADGAAVRIEALRDDLHRRLADGLPGRVRLNGPRRERLPNTLNISVDGVAGHRLLAAAPAVAASTGSACHSGAHTPSPVLTAMGLDAGRALGAVRLSLGRWTTSGDIATAATALTDAASARAGATASARDSTPRDADITVDGTGLLCVTLLLKLRDRIQGAAPGTVVHIIATDPVAPLDLPAWCHMAGHHYLGPVPGDDRPVYAVRLASSERRTRPDRPWHRYESGH
ncbi:cysteine desulfurase/sulfurtransferase TusA family protein [Microtetraspora malaysiensis]|uniref:cysteine desulfurase/sulfurtransferase TusA family protein n=1 Tax=Microtetraspora malaysiensis TaxID=161358 RepID=UPI003D8AE02C